MQWEPPLDTKGPVPESRKGHTLTLLPTTSTLLLFGGEDANGNLMNDMYLYSISQKTWTNPQYTSINNPRPRHRHTTTAISPHAVVVIGGETTSSNEPTHPDTTAVLDVWLFDVRTLGWTRIANDSPDVRDAPKSPAWRSGHSAVYMTLAQHSAAIYIFGGFFGTRDCDSRVFRLRIADWTWHEVQIVGHRGDSMPCHRELHSAVYIAALSGMLIIGGESDDLFHSDVWLLAPTNSRNKQWKWRHLPMRMAQNFPENSLPPASDACAFLLPTDRPMVMVWAGMSESDRLNALDMAYVLDLASFQSLRVRVQGCRKHTGRYLQAVVRYADRVFLSGGVSETGDVTDALQCVSLTGMLKGVSRAQAVDFGGLARSFADGLRTPDVGKEDAFGADLAEVDFQQMDRKEFAGAGRLMGPGSVLEGTAFSGKVTHCSRYGTHVSVVVGGRVHEGMLIAYAADGEDKSGGDALKQSLKDDRLKDDSLKDDVDGTTAGGDNQDVQVAEVAEVAEGGESRGAAEGQQHDDDQGAGEDRMEITRDDEANEEMQAEAERNDEDSLFRQTERKRKLDAANALPDPEDTVKRRPELDNNNNEVILLD